MKHGKLFSAVFTAAVVAAAIFVNLIVGALGNHVSLKIDTTKNRIFNLSENTKEYLSTLDEKITFYYLVRSGAESPYIKEVTEKYVLECDKISLKTVDYIKHPELVTKYAQNGEISSNSIIVESETRFKTVDPGSAFMVNFDEKGNLTQSLGFTLEQKITNAIDFVTREKNITVRYTQNHDEADFKIPAEKLKDENIDVQPVDLRKDDISAENTDLLVIFGARSELGDNECAKVSAYISAGGKLYVCTNPNVECETVEKITDMYGITVNNDAVTEGDVNRRLLGNKLYLSVDMLPHKITENISARGKLVFPATSSLTFSKAENTSITCLAQTYDSGQSRAISDEGLGEMSADGKLPVCALAENTENGSKIFVAGTTQFLTSVDPDLDNILTSVSYVNREFFVQTVKYMTDSEGMNISIAPKNIAVKSINLSLAQKVGFTGVFSFGLPLCVLAAAIIVWRRRKNL